MLLRVCLKSFGSKQKSWIKVESEKSGWEDQNLQNSRFLSWIPEQEFQRSRTGIRILPKLESRYRNLSPRVLQKIIQPELESGYRNLSPVYRRNWNSDAETSAPRITENSSLAGVPKQEFGYRNLLYWNLEIGRNLGIGLENPLAGVLEQESRYRNLLYRNLGIWIPEPWYRNLSPRTGTPTRVSVPQAPDSTGKLG